MPPRLTGTERPSLEAAYALAAARLATAWTGRDPGPLARLGRGLALLPPAALGPLVERAAACGAGLDALRLASAHCDGGGSPALLAAPVGGGRLIDVAEAWVLDGWGRRPAVDAEAARRLAELFLRVDPTDSYLHAATWARRAGGLTSTAGRGAARGGPGLLARVWCDWAGLSRDDRGALRVDVPTGGAPGGPWHLAGVPLGRGEAVSLRWARGAILVEADGRSQRVEPGSGTLLETGVGGEAGA